MRDALLDVPTRQGRCDLVPALGMAAKGFHEEPMFGEAEVVRVQAVLEVDVDSVRILGRGVSTVVGDLELRPCHLSFHRRWYGFLADVVDRP